MEGQVKRGRQLRWYNNPAMLVFFIKACFKRQAEQLDAKVGAAAYDQKGVDLRMLPKERLKFLFQISVG